jgi:hypothetical protein
MPCTEWHPLWESYRGGVSSSQPLHGANLTYKQENVNPCGAIRAKIPLFSVTITQKTSKNFLVAFLAQLCKRICFRALDVVAV